MRKRLLALLVLGIILILLISGYKPVGGIISGIGTVVFALPASAVNVASGGAIVTTGEEGTARNFISEGLQNISNHIAYYSDTHYGTNYINVVSAPKGKAMIFVLGTFMGGYTYPVPSSPLLPPPP